MASARDCIFCKIIQGTIPSLRLLDDDEFIAIRDIHPHAKIHLLVIPKRHVASLEEAFPQSGNSMRELVGRMFEAGLRVAREQGLLPGGFRSVINTGADALQTVHHLHLHLLGGETLGERLA